MEFFFIPSIDKVCGRDDKEKKVHGSVRRYKPLGSSTNCGVAFDDNCIASL